MGATDRSAGRGRARSRRGGERQAVAVLGIDGGGSKVDAVFAARDGTILGAARIRHLEHDGTGRELHLEGVRAAVHAAGRDAGCRAIEPPLASVAVACVAGADLPADDRRIGRWLEAQRWGRKVVLRNDTFAVLRAGTDRSWGVAVVCGYGTNCSGVAPSGRIFRLPAVGTISGDWGGGYDLGSAALWHALRAQDGRGDPTALTSLVPGHFGMRRPRQVMEAMYFGRMSEERLVELAPLVFEAARADDAVARTIVDRQADEIAVMATTAIRRLHMTRRDVHVVLGGGIFANRDPVFHERVVEGIGAVAPKAKVIRLSEAPVVGAVLLGLDALGATRAAAARVRTALTNDRMDRAGREISRLGASQDTHARSTSGGVASGKHRP